MLGNKVASTYSLCQEESERIGILKLLSIVLVVYIHSYNQGMNFASRKISLDLPLWLSVFENILSQNIARMSVPMFFIISAVLLFRHEQNYKNLMVKKAKRVLIPYLFWNTLWIAIFFILQQLEFTKEYFSNAENIIANFQFQNWLKAYGISPAGCYPFLYPLWFMRDLLVTTALYPLFKIIINKLPYLALCISCVMIFIPLNIPFGGAISFFLLGGCIVKFNWRMEKIDKMSYWLISVFYVAIIFLNLVVVNQIVYALVILFGIAFFVKTSNYLYRQKWVYSILKRLVPYTFIIYVGHELVLSSLKKICLKVLPRTDFILFSQYFLLPIFVMFGCVFAGYILKKHCSKVYLVITGEKLE